MSCLVRYGDIAFPIACEAVHKDILFSDVATKNMGFIHYDMKKKFITGVKANRLIECSEEEKKGQYQNLSTLNLKDGEKRIVQLKDLPFPVALIRKIFKKRRRIEVYHKSIKQNASLEKSPTKVTRSQKNHIFASIVAYCKLEFLKQKTSLNHFALKYKLLIKANQMAFQELKKLQEIPMPP